MMLENEDGYRLWLRYQKIEDTERLSQYQLALKYVAVLISGSASDVIQYELNQALPSLLDTEVPVGNEIHEGNGLVIGTVESLATAGILISPAVSLGMGDEGFLIRQTDEGNRKLIIITAYHKAGLVYGMYHFLRLLQTYQDVSDMDIVSAPKIKRRVLAHWDNTDDSVERGYAGGSIWRWDELPDVVSQRYRDYARACASVGINGSVLNNPNASPEVLSDGFLRKIVVIADVLRPYGVQVYLSANFNSPVLLGGLSTNDPRNPDVARWWKEKADEIYKCLPDFGGFQIKANSEGQPGPQDDGAGHDDGANMLAEAVAPHRGIVFWRAFVYGTDVDYDRAKCAYKEFMPLDGVFHPSVFVQVKNGPVDFQPREPFTPLFGAMTKTPLALEFQITQEYLGQMTHLVYLAPMWKEVLDADTYAAGEGTPVSKTIDGSLFKFSDSAIVGVANTGGVRNWCAHHFAQANWYAFGRLAWDYALSSEKICEEWVRMTWSNDAAVCSPITDMMLGSREACVNYMTPLGLHHIMVEGHHYGPNPAYAKAPREDWNNVYYHRADRAGLGFDRSSSGSNAVAQYFSPLREQFDNLETCPEKYLLWFHHVSWSHECRSGRLLMDELEYRYGIGVDYVKKMRQTWQERRGKIDQERFDHVAERLDRQLENAEEWRDVCTGYFRQFVPEKD